MDAEKQVQKLVGWIKDRVEAARCRGVVLGLSGGLDSAVLAVLCCRALPQGTLGVIMPCQSIEQDKSHAMAMASKFSIPTTEVNLDNVLDAMLRELPSHKLGNTPGYLALANLKARLRMVTLYYIANQLNYMVAGSSNRSEITVGYFTKYGDSGVDIMPLGNLVKGDVTELGHHLGIPREIIDKPPSAGLWEGQTDEDEMGLSYEALDHYILTGDAPQDLKNKIESMKAASEHKRTMPPIA